MTAQRPQGTQRHPTAPYRLLHSSGDHLITDRKTALQTLAALPGAKLFVLRDRGGEAQKGG